MQKKSSIVLVVCVLMLGAALRLYRLDFQSLWLDEGITVAAASQHFRSIIFQPMDPNILPLYYPMIHGLFKLGRSEQLLRLPSVLAGLLSIALMYGIVGRLLDRGTGALGAMLMAISPFHLWYSQEGRPYALLLCLALLSLWLLQQRCAHPANPWWRYGFMALTAAVFYCHVLGIAWLAVLSIYLLCSPGHVSRRQWCVDLCGILVLIAPGAYRLAVLPPGVSADTRQEFAFVSFVAYTIWAFGTGYSLGPTLAELHRPDRLHLVLSYWPLVVPSGCVFFGVFLWGYIQLARQSRGSLFFQASWFAVPLGLALLAARFTTHSFNVRYAILSFPAFVTGVAFGLKNLPTGVVRLVAVWVMVGISAASAWNYHFQARYQRENVREAGRYLTTQALDHDLIILNASYNEYTLQYYYAGKRAVSIVGYPPHDRRIVNTNLLHKVPASVPSSQVAHDMKHLVATRTRFWLFLSRTFDSDPQGFLRSFCDTTYFRELLLSWNGVELLLYRVPAHASTSPTREPAAVDGS